MFSRSGTCFLFPFPPFPTQHHTCPLDTDFFKPSERSFSLSSFTNHLLLLNLNRKYASDNKLSRDIRTGHEGQIASCLAHIHYIALSIFNGTHVCLLASSKLARADTDFLMLNHESLFYLWLAVNCGEAQSLPTDVLCTSSSPPSSLFSKHTTYKT